MKIYWTSVDSTENSIETPYTFEIRRAFSDFTSKLDKVYMENPRKRIREEKRIELVLYMLNFDERLVETLYKEQITEYEREYLFGNTFCIGEDAEETMFFLWRYEVPTYDHYNILVHIKTWEQ